MAYIGVSPSNGVRRVHTYTATASQTTFSGAGAEGTSLSYKDSNFVDVYQNGVKLGDADYTATSGTSIVLGTGATASDLVVIVVFDVFSVADTVSKADGGTFDNAVTITTADNNAQLTLVSTDADASVGPQLDLFRNSASPADSDVFGRIRFLGENDASEQTAYATIFTKAVDVSDGTEDANIRIDSIVGGTNTQRLEFNATEAVFNEGSADIDFRVESNGNANMLFVDGENDRVGIGTATFGASSHKLEVDGGSGETRLRISSTGTDLREAGIILANSSKSNDNDGIVIAHGGASTTFDDLGGNELLRLSQSSNKMSFKLGANNEGFISNTNNNQTDVLMLLRDTSGSGGTAVRFRTGTSQVGTITINTNSTAYNTSSDYRLKENVDYTFDATTRLKQLKPARFNFISDDTNTLVDGFLAHEVSHDADGNPLVPEAIYGSKDAVEVWKANEELPDGVSVGDNKLDGDGNTIPDYQGIDQSKLVPLLTKALQEQQATIEALTARITALEEA